MHARLSHPRRAIEERGNRAEWIYLKMSFAVANGDGGICQIVRQAKFFEHP